MVMMIEDSSVRSGKSCGARQNAIMAKDVLDNVFPKATVVARIDLLSWASSIFDAK